jgi:MFS family permease
MTGPAVSTWSALRHPVMRAILLSETISALGSQMTFLALPWFVLVTTGSATRMGLVFAVELIPVAVFGVPSGLLVQRLGVRRTMLAGDLLRAPLTAAIPLLYALGLLSFPVLLAVVFVVGACSGPYLSAQRLVVPETFADDETLVVQGNALIEGATRLAALAGPALAGALITAVGPVPVLWIQSGTFLLSFGVLLARLPRPQAPLGEAGPAGRMLDGVRYVLGNPALRRVSAAALAFGLVFPLLLASLPVVAQRRYHGEPRVAGLLFAAWGAGALLGAYGVMRLAAKVSPMRLGAVAALALALPLWLLGLPLAAWQFGAVMLVSGLFTPMLNAPVATLILVRTPAEKRVQVITFVMTANLIAGPLGYALAGPALDQLGIAATLLVAAAVSTLAALLLVPLARLDVAEAAADALAGSL